MNESTEEIILIEKYLEGALNSDEKAAFELRLKEDENLNSLVDEYAILIAGVKHSGRDKMLSKFQQIEQELEQSKVVEMKPASRKLWYYAAASVILLCTALFVFRSFNQPEMSEVALSYFNPYPATIGAVDRSAEDTQTLISEAMGYYENGEYAQSIVVLNQILETGNLESKEVHQFYLANAYQANNEFDKAENIYLSLIGDGRTFHQQASWNLALCYLSKGQKTETLKVLNNTNFTFGNYTVLSRKLQEELQ